MLFIISAMREIRHVKTFVLWVGLHKILPDYVPVTVPLINTLTQQKEDVFLIAMECFGNMLTILLIDVCLRALQLQICLLIISVILVF